MIPWANIWFWVVWSALGLYFGLGLIIIIGGLGDIRKMFRRLNEQHDERTASAFSAHSVPPGDDPQAQKFS